MLRAILFTLALALAPGAAHAQMTGARLAEIAEALDPAYEVSGNAIRFTVEDVPVSIIHDQVHDRMRAMVLIRTAQGLDAEALYRMMQANFDSALDARYAIAQRQVYHLADA
ncbi:MAG: hypothetical protein AAF439_00270 [Pseudomonadota bacterium]